MPPSAVPSQLQSHASFSKEYELNRVIRDNPFHVKQELSASIEKQLVIVVYAM